MTLRFYEPQSRECNCIQKYLQRNTRRCLEALVRDRNTPHKHVWRAESVLLSVDGARTKKIMRRRRKSKTCIWRWQERFMQEGYGGLLRAKTRASRS
jgi:hypothetical protein